MTESLEQHSRMILLTNQQPNGAYLACPTMPDYRYSWFRDGAYISSALTPDSRYRIFDEKGPLDFALAVTGLSGQYKLTEYTLDRQRGSIFDTWLACGAPPSHTAEELDWLRRQAGPDLKVAFLENPGHLNRTVTVQTHGVTLLELQKLV